MKRYLTLLVIVLLGAAFAAGYWPEHQRRASLEGEVRSLQEQLAEAQGRVRLAGLLVELLNLTDAVSEKNYGHAQGLSSAFFDRVRAEAAQARPAFKEALEGTLRRRDSVTAGLTQADPAVLGALRQAQSELRAALGHPPAATAAEAAPAPSPAP